MAHQPKQITELWAWIVREADGGDGVPAMTLPVEGIDHMTPMMGADEERVRSLEPHAREIAARFGCPLRLVRFSHGEVIEEWGPP